jgi:hypothetical protein
MEKIKYIYSELLSHSFSLSLPMFTPFLLWCASLWPRLTGVEQRQCVDPVFRIRVDARFKHNVSTSDMWQTDILAKRLLTEIGVCAHPSVLMLNRELDRSISRMHLIEGYVSMCLAVREGVSYYTLSEEQSEKVLPGTRIASSALPEGWTRVAEEDRLNFVQQMMLRNERRTEQLRQYSMRWVKNEVKRKLTACVPTTNEECAICLNQEGVWKVLPVCGHMFHEDCIVKVNPLICPLCRACI